ncbi:hypothetical protein VTI28DRAFT_2021 [Corynascus sepedonium]
MQGAGTGRRRLQSALLGSAFASGTLALPVQALLGRADGNREYSPPKRATANNVAAALITVLIATAIIVWLVWRLVTVARNQVIATLDPLSTTDSSSNSSSDSSSAQRPKRWVNVPLGGAAGFVFGHFFPPADLHQGDTTGRHGGPVMKGWKFKISNPSSPWSGLPPGHEYHSGDESGGGRSGPVS